jgi:hypothetical protein
MIGNSRGMEDEASKCRRADTSVRGSRLAANMGMTGELEYSITKLAELQCFLKSQINSAEDEGHKEMTATSPEVVPSLYLESSRVENCGCGCFQRVREMGDRVRKYRKMFKAARQCIVREVSDFLADLKDIFNDNFMYLSSLTTRKINEALRYKLQVQKMKLEIDELKHKNLNLQLKV